MISLRDQVADKLTRVALRLRNTQHREFVTVFDPNGQRIVELTILGDAYGHGLSKHFEASEPTGYLVE